MTNRKKETEAALHRYYERIAPKPPKPKRKNSKPELKLTQEPCIAWLKANGFRVKVNESKYKYNEAKGKWLSAGIRKGTPDLNATDQYGHSCWIECKAPGKLATINKREDQRRFIEKEAKHGAFACVVDSVVRLAQIYSHWLSLRQNGKFNESKTYLLSTLPKQKEDNAPLFTEAD